MEKSKAVVYKVDEIEHRETPLLNARFSNLLISSKDFNFDVTKAFNSRN